MGGGGKAFFKRAKKPTDLLRPSELENVNDKRFLANHYLSHRPFEVASQPLDPSHAIGCSVEQHWDEEQKRCVDNGMSIVGKGLLSVMTVSLILAWFSGNEALKLPLGDGGEGT